MQSKNNHPRSSRTFRVTFRRKDGVITWKRQAILIPSPGATVTHSSLWITDICFLWSSTQPQEVTRQPERLDAWRRGRDWLDLNDLYRSEWSSWSKSEHCSSASSPLSSSPFHLFLPHCVHIVHQHFHFFCLHLLYFLYQLYQLYFLHHLYLLHCLDLLHFLCLLHLYLLHFLHFHCLYLPHYLCPLYHISFLHLHNFVNFLWLLHFLHHLHLLCLLHLCYPLLHCPLLHLLNVPYFFTSIILTSVLTSFISFVAFNFSFTCFKSFTSFTFVQKRPSWMEMVKARAERSSRTRHFLIKVPREESVWEAPSARSAPSHSSSSRLIGW